MPESILKTAVWKNGALGDRQRDLLFAQLPDHLRRVARRFNQATGLSIVVTVAARKDGRSLPTVMIPPIHPVCTERAAHTLDPLPCADQWDNHVRRALQGRGPDKHTCELGLRCACVPVAFGGSLVGLCKLVAGSEVSDHEFSLALEVLKALVDAACHQLHAMALVNELSSLRGRIDKLQSLKLRLADGAAGRRKQHRGPPPPDGNAAETRSLVARALELLSDAYTDADLSVAEVARRLDTNDKYLSHVFSRHVGQRMRAYVVELRIRRSCELLLTTDWQVKRVANASGFKDAAQFGRCFRRQVGVAPGEYRRIFAPPG